MEAVRRAVEAMSSADIVCFLGFGFHELNLETLEVKRILTTHSKDALGSAKGFREGEQLNIRRMCGGVNRLQLGDLSSRLPRIPSQARCLAKLRRTGDARSQRRKDTRSAARFRCSATVLFSAGFKRLTAGQRPSWNIAFRRGGGVVRPGRTQAPAVVTCTSSGARATIVTARVSLRVAQSPCGGGWSCRASSSAIERWRPSSSLTNSSVESSRTSRVPMLPESSSCSFGRPSASPTSATRCQNAMCPPSRGPQGPPGTRDRRRPSLRTRGRERLPGSACLASFRHVSGHRNEIGASPSRLLPAF